MERLMKEQLLAISVKPMNGIHMVFNHNLDRRRNGKVN
jgi:hypothetical protein